MVAKSISLLLPLLAFLSFASMVTADATEDARQEIVRGMGKGLQNNIELRRMLIGKYQDAPEEAIEQYRHIVRIQMETFGADSPEAAAAVKEGADFAATHGLDPALAIYKEEPPRVRKEEL